MSTQSQISANRQNAQHSSGPKTAEGKASSSRNNFRHGFTGTFCLLPGEDREEFDSLVADLLQEHQPETVTETLLIKKMAQHHWLVQRAILFQEAIGRMNASAHEEQRALALYLRYQTTNDRAFHKCLDQLVKLRAEKRKTQLDEAALSKRAEDSRIGFESQQRKRNEEARKQAEQARRDSVEKRKQELHKFAVLRAEARLKSELKQNLNGESAENATKIAA